MCTRTRTAFSLLQWHEPNNKFKFYPFFFFFQPLSLTNNFAKYQNSLESSMKMKLKLYAASYGPYPNVVRDASVNERKESSFGWVEN